MMSATNGSSKDENNMVSMEMESLHPGSTTVRTSPKPPASFLSNLWMLIRLHIESHPQIFSIVGLVGLAFFMYVAVEYSRPPMERHKVTTDYSNIKLDYDFKATQIDHWCLFGGDNACACDDFTEPVPRDEIPGWLDAHNANKASIDTNVEYDIVFLGADIDEARNGKALNMALPDGERIKQNFVDTFMSESNIETSLNVLSLGIAGDSTSNLLWRIQHGEMPEALFSKIFWISIGANDMARGGCSEEATTLGILRVAEEVAYNNPAAIVVVSAILPRSSRSDGSLESVASSHNPLFGKKHSEKHNAELARKKFQLWPSIKTVNKEVEDFCTEHKHIVYFNADDLFLGTVSNYMYRGKSQQIMADLMPDYKNPSLEGHKILNQKIREEFDNIVLDDDEGNDIEEKATGGNRQLLRQTPSQQ